MYELILKKRNGEELTEREIDWIINSYTENEIPDYQMSAFLMAVYFRGMTDEETVFLTKAMLNSGKILETDYLSENSVDKHSTGGVGDTTSIILGPLVAAAGAKVPKMSGRGLGHTGGTLDKLESFPGLRVELDSVRFQQVVEEVGIAIVSQTQDLAPADKLLYALRDATATVDSIPLIASSIMSKKIAAGAPAIVLDVKVGRGAFMTNIQDARLLAEAMVRIGCSLGKRVTAVITAMNAPLGFAVGNILEVKEAIDVLNGSGPQDISELCITLGAEMLVLSGLADDALAARKTLRHMLTSGQGVHKLADLVRAQGGDDKYVYHPELFPRSRYVHKVRSQKSGYISTIDGLTIGQVAMSLGAGRAKKGDEIDLTAGIQLKCQRGMWVNAGDIIAEIHTNIQDKIEDSISAVISAICVGKEPAEQQPLIYEIVRSR